MSAAAFSGVQETRCSSLNHCCCSGVPPGMYSEVNNWRKAGLSRSRPMQNQVEQNLGFLPLLVRMWPLQPALGIRSEEDQVRYPLRVASRVGDRQRASLARPNNANRCKARASATVSRSLTRESNASRGGDQSERPQPRWS